MQAQYSQVHVICLPRNHLDTGKATSPDKQEDAHAFGAKDVLINKDGADFSKYKGAFDFILDTIPYQHDLNRFIPLLSEMRLSAVSVLENSRLQTSTAK